MAYHWAVQGFKDEAAVSGGVQTKARLDEVAADLESTVHIHSESGDLPVSYRNVASKISLALSIHGLFMRAGFWTCRPMLVTDGGFVYYRIFVYQNQASWYPMSSAQWSNWLSNNMGVSSLPTSTLRYWYYYFHTSEAALRFQRVWKSIGSEELTSPIAYPINV